jgi:hypothetical protein
MPAKSRQKSVYQLKVGLLETRPLVWRRFLIPSEVTLHRLHLVLQVVMGWKNYHAYRFQTGTSEYAALDPDNELHELNFKNSKQQKLGKLVSKPGSLFLYEYDFGDSWNHEMLLEAILTPEPGRHYPICLAGERACPPEDCSGSHGYAHMLKVISDPKHEEYKNYLTWLGGHFNPDQFSIDAINRRLSTMKLK